MVDWRKVDNRVRPVLLYLFLVFQNWIFISMDFIPDYYDSTHWLKITEIVIYECLFIMAVWSHLKTLCSNPGHIKTNKAAYDPSKLHPVEARILNSLYLKQAAV
jgi:hypothetical protein